MLTDAALTPEKVATAAERLKVRYTNREPAELGTPADLAALADSYGLTVDSTTGGAGKYRDVSIGTGAPYHNLAGFVAECKRAGLLARVQQVNNPGHEHYGKVYAEVSSFWWEG